MTLPAGKKPAQRLGRRGALEAACAGALALFGTSTCGPTAGVSAAPVPPTPPATRSRAGSADRVELYSWFDLPSDDPRSRELSGIAWDAPSRTLWSVQDASANLVPILPDRDFKRWSLGTTIELRTSFPLDLEGVVVLDDGFIVASEKGPRILEVDRAGKLRRDIPLPAHFADARDNKSLESLTMDPGQRFLFTTSEGSLSCDGELANPQRGARLRILRIDRQNGAYEEHAYTTDPAPHTSGDYGVADLAALSKDDLLVLERGWTRGEGNTARVYRAQLTDGSASCLSLPSLGEGTTALAKNLVIDLSTLPAQGLPASKQRQKSALLDNFEGMAIGPRLPDGRASILLISDDNGRSDQFARILVLAVG